MYTLSNIWPIFVTCIVWLCLPLQLFLWNVVLTARSLTVTFQRGPVYSVVRGDIVRGLLMFEGNIIATR